MVKLTCKKCGAVHTVELANEFTGCSCGSTLPASSVHIIDDAYWKAFELLKDVKSHSLEGLHGDFEVHITV